MSAMRTAKLKRIAAACLALLGWAALVLQYVLLLQNIDALGLSTAEGTIRFFSFFTIQSNILVALVLTAFAIKSGPDEWLVHPFVRSAVAVYIALVGIVYFAVLRQLWAPKGAQWVADVVLHYAMPLGYLAFWLTCVRKAGLRWYDPLLWLIYPLFYLAFILVRGKLAGFYPYPFINVGTLGYAKVAFNTLGLLIVCAALGTIFVAVGWWLSRRQKP
ncbi:hypothetical protein V1291_003118 [Nitrobacteraceae bacterium AZCC 1564]